MILPSDSDLPSDRNDDDDDLPSGKPEETDNWWDDADDEPEADGDELPDDLDGADDPNAPQLQSIAGPGWRNDLYKDLLESLRDIEAIEDPDDDFSPPEPPDLYTFFGELAALRNELRHQAQRSNDSLNHLEKTLAPVLRPAGKSNKTPGGKALGSAPASGEPWPPETCLALVSAWDLLPHATSAAAFEASLQPLLQAAGLTRIPTTGQPFDPATMTLAGTEPAVKKSPSGIVVRETAAGFLRGGGLLRPASVIVSG